MTPLIHSLLREKMLVLLITLGFAWYVSPTLALTLFIVFGQGHFLMTYLYQNRGNKITTQYLMSYGIVAAAIFFWLIPILPYDMLLVITASIFAIHFVFDEARLLEQDPNRVNILLLLPPILSFVGMLILSRYGMDWMPVIIAGSFILIGFMWFFCSSRMLWQPYVGYTNLITFFLWSLYAADVVIPTAILFGSIIVYHYATWYVHFYFKLHANLKRQGTFIAEAVVLNVLLIVLYFLYASGEVAALRFVFEPAYFYGWTLLHILFASQELFQQMRRQLVLW